MTIPFALAIVAGIWIGYLGHRAVIAIESIGNAIIDTHNAAMERQDIREELDARESTSTVRTTDY